MEDVLFAICAGHSPQKPLRNGCCHAMARGHSPIVAIRPVKCITTPQEKHVIRSTLAVAFTVLALVMGACDSDTTNRNANMNASANHNGSVSNTNTTTVANSNSSPSDHDGKLTREDFEKQKDRIAREAKELGHTIGNGADDLWIWTKTRASLAGADDLRDSTIEVDVDNNAVTLKGTVATAAQKAKAESVTKSVEGVRSVKNLLKVGPSDGSKNVNARHAN